MPLRFIALTLAFAALASAHTAQAQQAVACIASADLADGVVYAMPIAFGAARTACASQLSRNGFMATGGEAFITNFRVRQDQAWPGAFRMLKVFMTQKDGAAAKSDADMTAMITALPESSLRPFVDGLVGQMIAGEIKPKSCSKIERGLELVSPLPSENVGGVIAFIAEFADMEEPKICPASEPAAAQ